VFLAQEFDAVADGVPYLSPRRTRLVAPDLRARVVGYLATAPEAAPGFRTDGVWVWPAALAEQARVHGARPQDQLFQHMRERWFLLPDAVSDEDLAEAARVAAGPPTPDPEPSYVDEQFFLGERPGEAPRPLLLWLRRDRQGNASERLYTMDGWTRTTRLADKRARPGLDPWEYREIGEREAAAINTENANRNSRAALDVARERPPGEGGLRVAGVFDGEDPSGAPWFSARRLRLPEPLRRRRLAEYLSQGHLVLRASGQITDPLDSGSGSVLPLSYRTDGVWVWWEASAYYLLHRGVAPELELLCHIEEQGYRLPSEVPADVLVQASRSVMAPPAPAQQPEPMAYLRSDAGGLFRARGGSVFRTDEFGPDLRWTGSDRYWRSKYSDSDEVFSIIPEQEAIADIEARWRRGAAVPPQI
jgi:hypothetical protein